MGLLLNCLHGVPRFHFQRKGLSFRFLLFSFHLSGLTCHFNICRENVGFRISLQPHQGAFYSSVEIVVKEDEYLVRIVTV